MSSADLHKAMLALMDVLACDITRTEVMADDLTQAAVTLTHRPEAKAVQDTVIGMRVKVIELRAQLAALRERYDGLFPAKP